MVKILIVDDHPLYREGLSATLARRVADAEVLGAANVAEGLALLDSNPGIDLVLIDIHLPGPDGFAALDLYRRAHPAVARVLVSGHSLDEADLQRAMQAGASGFIPKTLTVHRMIDAITRILEGGIFVPASSEVAGHEPAAATERVAGFADTPPRADLERVTRGMSLRQLEVLTLLGQGRSNKDIARCLDIAERTVKAHATRVFELLEVANRTQAVLAAQKLGLLAAT
jgi:two-component system, NarL family, nitrate/nitrite response regulator NarL